MQLYSKIWHYITLKGHGHWHLNKYWFEGHSFTILNLVKSKLSHDSCKLISHFVTLSFAWIFEFWSLNPYWDTSWSGGHGFNNLDSKLSSGACIIK